MEFDGISKATTAKEVEIKVKLFSLFGCLYNNKQDSRHKILWLVYKIIKKW